MHQKDGRVPGGTRFGLVQFCPAANGLGSSTRLVNHMRRHQLSMKWKEIQCTHRAWEVITMRQS